MRDDILLHPIVVEGLEEDMQQEWDGNRIRHLRTALGLSQEKLAERLGVTFATVNRWENAATQPSRLSRAIIYLTYQPGHAILSA